MEKMIVPIQRNFYLNGTYAFLLFLMAALLHQSGEIFEINLSLSDIFCLLVILLLFLHKQLLVPIAPGTFFLFLSGWVLLIALYYIPDRFFYVPNPKDIIIDYMKLTAIFFYFLLGYNLERLGWTYNWLKIYAFFGLLIGFAGILLTILNISLFREFFFYDSIRYKGLMIDPNYFAVLQMTALAYFLRKEELKTLSKWIFSLIIFLAILVSGSKTGLITLFLYFNFFVIERLIFRPMKPFLISVLFLLGGFVAIIFPLLYTLLETLAKEWGGLFPTIERVRVLFTDFSSAVTESGSERDGIWQVALEIIKQSPFFGVGIGTYSGLSLQLFHEPHVAHNTFLQLLAEWGIPISILFFSFVMYLVIKATISSDSGDETKILRDMMIVLLIGSMAVSLNNARILWLILGALMAKLSGKILNASGGSYDFESSGIFKAKKTDV